MEELRKEDIPVGLIRVEDMEIPVGLIRAEDTEIPVGSRRKGDIPLRWLAGSSGTRMGLVKIRRRLVRRDYT